MDSNGGFAELEPYALHQHPASAISGVTRTAISVLLLIGILCMLQVFGQDADIELPAEPSFSFNEPSTFTHGTEQQKDVLRAIAKEEFSLEHLSIEDQELLSEALRYSGVEVQDTCVIEHEMTFDIRAFTQRMKANIVQLVHPELGQKPVEVHFEPEDPDSEPLGEPIWTAIEGDYADFPIPFAESELLPKIIPVNLSSIRRVSNNKITTEYRAAPSRLLVANAGDDEFIDLKHVDVEFSVDRQTRRVIDQRLKLRKPQKLTGGDMGGMRLTRLDIYFQFGHDAVSNRNVATKLEQEMRARVAAVFRPRFEFEHGMSSLECLGEPSEHSYLYETVDAIANLDSVPDG